MVIPMTSYPCSFNSAAVTEESTPPLMATTTRFFTSTSEKRPRHKRSLSKNYQQKNIDKSGVFFFVILDRFMQGIGGQIRTVHFGRRQTIKGLRNRLIGQYQRLIKGLADGEFCYHGRCGNRRTAPKGLELHILDDVAFDLQVDLHYITTGGIADFAHPVSVFDFTNITWVAEMVHDFFCVHPSISNL